MYPFAVCFTLHILLTLRIRCGNGRKKKTRLFPCGVFDKIKGGGALRVVGGKDRNPSERREGQSGESDE